MASSQRPEVTASTCNPSTAHGAHLFTTERYGLYKGIGVGKCIWSATFAISGHDWCLCFYPDGDKEDNKDWVSVFLELKTDDVVARVVYDLTLIDQATQLLPCPNPSEINPVVFDSTIVEEDAVITFSDAEVGVANEICDFKVPRSDLSDNLSKLLEATEGSDVSFKVKEEVFPAHEIILAMRSPVFRAEFMLTEDGEHVPCVAV